MFKLSLFVYVAFLVKSLELDRMEVASVSRNDRVTLVIVVAAAAEAAAGGGASGHFVGVGSEPVMPTEGGR